MKNKINNIFKRIKEFFNHKNNWGIISLGLIVVVFLIVSIIYLLGTRNVSVIEQNTLKEQSKDLINYIDDIVESDSDEIDKYIIFALDYSSDLNDNAELTVEEIYNFLTEHFTLETSAEEIRNEGVSPLMLEHNILYDEQNDSYKIATVQSSSSTTIADTQITYYKVGKITKKNKKKYVVTYSRYIIEDPYKMLNYYIDQNTQADSDDIVDITPIRNYLTGGSSLSDLKNNINENDLSNFAKKSGKIKITYVVKDEKLYIAKIK